MPSLTKAEPPAWAVNLGLSLLDMAEQNKVLQAMLQMAETNCQLQGAAAQGQADQAENIAENQADQTWQDAAMAITQGSISLGSSIIQFGMQASNYGNIKQMDAELKNVNGYDQAIQDIETPQRVVGLESPEGQEDGEDLEGQGPEGIPNRDPQRLLNHPIASEAITPDDEADIKFLSESEDEGQYTEFKKMVASKKKTLEKSIQSSQQEKESFIQRFKGLFDGTSQAIGYMFQNNKANDQWASAAYQYLKAIADYVAQATNTANQTIMGQKDQMYNLMISTDQSLIAGMAQANKVA